jgi:hypothetical protein
MRRISADDFNDQYSKILYEPADSHVHYDISVDDLVVRDVEQTLGSKVEELCKQWKVIDNQYVTEEKVRDKDFRWGNKGFLAIPQGLSLELLPVTQSALTMTHPRIKEEVKQEYLTALRNLIAKVPKARILMKEREEREHLHLKELKVLIDKDGIQAIGKNQSYSQIHPYIDDMRAIECPPCFLPVPPPKEVCIIHLCISI